MTADEGEMVRVKSEVNESPQCQECGYTVHSGEQVTHRVSKALGVVIEAQIQCPRCDCWIDVHGGIEIGVDE